MTPHNPRDVHQIGGNKSALVPSDFAAPHFEWPRIEAETESAVLRQLHETISIYDDSGVMGRVERQLADFFGTKHALMISSGTMALYTAFAAAGVGPGDEILCPAYTFLATITPALALGAVPVLVDVDERGNLDPGAAEMLITAATKAIVVTHMWGIPARIADLQALAKRHGLLLIEDGSHAHGAAIGDRRIGSFGDMAAFSLQGPKPISGGEGGVLLTDSDDLYYEAVAWGHYNKRCKSEIPSDHYLHQYATTGYGLKLRAHPLALAIIEQQLSTFGAVLKGRGRTAAAMTALIESTGYFECVLPRHNEIASWYALPVLAPIVGSPSSTRRAHEALLARGCLEADRPGSTGPLNDLPLLQDPGRLYRWPQVRYRKYSSNDFPGARAFHDRLIKIPVWDREEDSAVALSYARAFEEVGRQLQRGD